MTCEESWSQTDCFQKLLLAANVKHFFENEILCDITVVTQKAQIPAHKVILAASSTYFKLLFTSALSSSDNVVNMFEYEPDALEAIIKYIYSGEIVLNETNIFQIIELEDLLQVGSLRSICCQYLKSEINSKNCWLIKAECDFRSYKDVAEAAFFYIKEHFHKIIESPDFLDVPYDLLMECLNSTYLAIPNEDVFLLRLCDWILHDPDERLKYFHNVVSHISLIRITNWKCCVRSLSNKFADIGCSDLINKWIQESDEKRHEPITDEHQYRECITNVVLAIGGCCGNRVLGTVECLPSYLKPWKLMLPVTTVDNHSLGSPKSPAFPVMNQPRWGATVASTSNKVFIIGGWGGFGTGSELSSVEMYDVGSNAWTDLPSLPKPICSGAAAVLDNRLYLSGGFIPPNKPTINSLWVLNEKSNSWKQLTSMIFCRREHGLVAVNSALFAVGGLGADGNSLGSVERYDPLTNSWLEVAPMTIPRMRHGCVAIDHYIYVIRGKLVTNDNDKTVEDFPNERYNTLTNEWSAILPSETGRKMTQRGVRSVAYGKSIFTTGGTSGLSVEVYNTVIGETTDGPTMNQERTGKRSTSSRDLSIRIVSPKGTKSNDVPFGFLTTSGSCICYECNLNFDNCADCLRHLKAAHPPAENLTHAKLGTWSCHFCLSDFPTEVLLAKHLRESHSEISFPSVAAGDEAGCFSQNLEGSQSDSDRPQPPLVSSSSANGNVPDSGKIALDPQHSVPKSDGLQPNSNPDHSLPPLMSPSSGSSNVVLDSENNIQNRDKRSDAEEDDLQPSSTSHCIPDSAFPQGNVSSVESSLKDSVPVLVLPGKVLCLVPGNNLTTIVCPLCALSFDPVQLESHVIQKHCDHTIISAGGSYKCKHCQSSSETLNSLLEHEKICTAGVAAPHGISNAIKHPKAQEPSTNSKALKTSSQSKVPKHPKCFISAVKHSGLTCMLCSKSFRSTKKFSSHIKRVHLHTSDSII